MIPPDLPRWAAADPILVLMVRVGLTLDEAFEKVERMAILAEQADARQPGARLVYGDHELAQALRAWDPAREPMPIRGAGA